MNDIGTWIPLALFAIAWLGTLVYTQGRQAKINESITESIKKIETDTKELKQWGEKQIAERIAFNQANYLSSALFSECNKDLTRRLENIEEYKIDSRLAAIETQLVNVMAMQQTLLEEIKRR